VVVVVDSSTGKLVAGPEIHARGSGIDDAAFDDIRPRIEEALERAAADGISDSYQLQQLIRRTVGRWVSDGYRRRPMIIPVLVEV
jgi:ribonuclease J